MKYAVSTKPIWHKLRLQPGYRALVLAAPDDYATTLATWPEGVERTDKLSGQLDWIQWFVRERSTVEQELAALKAVLKPAGLLWVCYPKGKVLPTDLNRDRLWEAAEPFGFQAVAQVAIDAVWSALRFKHA